MLVKLSSKGQLVIPKEIRSRLRLDAGTRLHIRTTADGNILLEPVPHNVLDLLFGKFADADLLTDLEREHQQEMEDESQFRS
ncbi:MAG: AbrB/MazE/SpoVT family DNA-binding domain-containing protein [Ardenticatenaceae bacterium]|nr:AbrB/MazE/SpoVT family DNA-binding domain-containing protein [Anaerolineales bacterium]MCB8917737.1 AbrB/MazE/SpoVT family DNA-binding domain-containing protein [Ardenticatenaceae bacterium]